MRNNFTKKLFFLFSKFVKWAGLNTSAGQFWSTGRMFDDPFLDNVYCILYIFSSFSPECHFRNRLLLLLRLSLCKSAFGSFWSAPRIEGIIDEDPRPTSASRASAWIFKRVLTKCTPREIYRAFISRGDAILTKWSPRYCRLSDSITHAHTHALLRSQVKLKRSMCRRSASLSPHRWQTQLSCSG